RVRRPAEGPAAHAVDQGSRGGTCRRAHRPVPESLAAGGAVVTALMRSVVRWLCRPQRGAAMVWLAVMLPFFLSIVGLAVDGGAIFRARRDLQDVADSAARAAAMQIDQNVYRASSGSTIVIDPSAARAMAGGYLSEVQDV